MSLLKRILRYMGILLKTRKLALFVKEKSPQITALKTEFGRTDIADPDVDEAIATAHDLKLIKEVDSNTGVTTNDYGLTLDGKYFIKGWKYLPYGVFFAWLDHYKLATQIGIPTTVTLVLFGIKWWVTGSL